MFGAENTIPFHCMFRCSSRVTESYFFKHVLRMCKRKYTRRSKKSWINISFFISLTFKYYFCYVRKIYSICDSWFRASCWYHDQSWMACLVFVSFDLYISWLLHLRWHNMVKETPKIKICLSNANLKNIRSLYTVSRSRDGSSQRNSNPSLQIEYVK